VRYKVWRSNKDKEFLCSEGSEAFQALPVAIRNLRPWTGSKEGEVGDLRLALRSLLVDQGFVIVHAHVSKLKWGITPEELLAMRRTRLDQGTDRAIGRGGDHKMAARPKCGGTC
jgi:hypothetical protein